MKSKFIVLFIAGILNGMDDIDRIPVKKLSDDIPEMKQMPLVVEQSTLQQESLRLKKSANQLQRDMQKKNAKTCCFITVCCFFCPCIAIPAWCFDK